MARKLKTYQTSLGFFDLAVAAPSMKSALEAWGADSNLFHQGAAKQSEDPDVIAATMAAPGVVLKRPVGSSGPFKEQAELPTNIVSDNISKKAGSRSVRPKPQKHPKRANDQAADREAALAFEKEQKRRERERRQTAVEKAQSALNVARREHEKIASDIQAELKALEERSQAEGARWEKEKARLEAALRRARG